MAMKFVPQSVLNLSNAPSPTVSVLSIFLIHAHLPHVILVWYHRLLLGLPVGSAYRSVFKNVFSFRVFFFFEYVPSSTFQNLSYNHDKV